MITLECRGFGSISFPPTILLAMFRKAYASKHLPLTTIVSTESIVIMALVLLPAQDTNTHFTYIQIGPG